MRTQNGEAHLSRDQKKEKTTRSTRRPEKLRLFVNKLIYFHEALSIL